MGMSATARHIKKYVSIDTLIEVYEQPIKKAGRIFYRCPLHPDKNPSLTVSKARGSFKCFGCNEHGDVFDFVMKLDKCSFLDACKKLVDMFSVPPPIREIRSKLHAEVYSAEREGRSDDAKVSFGKYIDTKASLTNTKKCARMK